jgi:hypothetical protein
VSRARIAMIHVALPLVLGAGSYIVLRSWVPLLGAHAALWAGAPALLRHHAADALWGWALGGFVTVVWLEQPRILRIAWTLVAAGLAAAIEVSQGVHQGWGAFDRADLVIQVGAVLVAALVIGGSRRWILASVAR